MTTAKEQFKSDLQKDPEDLEREADDVRENLEGTVDKLMHQLSPSELIDQGISFFRSKGDFDFVRNLVRHVENNPVPTVLAGVSLIWLMTASGQSSAMSGERLKSTSHDAAERARETGQQVATGASDVMHRVSDASRHTAESARDGLRNARESYTEMLREQPLLVGVLAVAAGAALGALLPRTSAEDRMVGGLSDKGTDTLKEKAQSRLKEEQDKLKEAQDKAAPEGNGRDAAAASTSYPEPPQLDAAPPR